MGVFLIDVQGVALKNKPMIVKLINIWEVETQKQWYFECFPPRRRYPYSPDERHSIDWCERYTGIPFYGGLQSLGATIAAVRSIVPIGATVITNGKLKYDLLHRLVFNGQHPVNLLSRTLYKKKPESVNSNAILLDLLRVYHDDQRTD